MMFISLEKRAKIRPIGVTSKNVDTDKCIILFNNDWWRNFAACRHPMLPLSVYKHTHNATKEKRNYTIIQFLPGWSIRIHHDKVAF